MKETVIKLSFDTAQSPIPYTPEDLIRRIKDWFPDSTVSLECGLVAEANRVQTAAKSKRVGNDDGVQNIVRSLLDKARRMGPVYRFTILMDGKVEVRGHSRPGHVVFMYKGELSEKSEQAMFDLLKSLNVGVIEKE
jgi:hypothetical protein